MNRISDCVDILIVLPFYLGYLWAADKFCKKFLGASPKREWLFLILSFCGWLLNNILCRLYAMPYIFGALSSRICFMALVLLLFQSGWEKKILAASVLMLTASLAAETCDSFLSCLVLLYLHIVKNIPKPFFTDLESGLLSGIGCCFAVWVIYRMSGQLEPVFRDKRKKWYVMLAVPLLVIITVYEVAGWGASNGIMVRSGGSMGLYYDQIFSQAGFLVLMFLSMAAAWTYVFGMNRIYLEQEKSDRYHSQIAVYKMLAERHRQSERLRHDIKNHIIALTALSRNKEWEKIDKYLESMGDIALDTGGDMTGNKVVDALLYQKKKQAEEAGIRWECDVQIPRECRINEFDLCVLFGNVLDNALEACGRMRGDECRFINIQAKTVKKCFLIEVKNSMDKAERFTGGFANKRDSQEHGIGLLNVGDVVHGYDGALNAEAENGIFLISVLIPFPDATHDIKTAV